MIDRPLRELFTQPRALLDLRAPVEFAQGAFPGAVNLPLLEDDERARVGTCYKHHGQEAAIALGERLVSGAVREQRLAGWLAFARAHPEGWLYCFRGGLRSRLVQAALHEAGVTYRRVPGGYKAMRRFLIEELECEGPETLLILGGRTGTGKTALLNQVHRSLDLEALAHHRGSGFGQRAHGQPPQIGFENALAVALLRQRERGCQQLLLEDEGCNIGSRSLPHRLHQRMQCAPLVVLEADLAQRVEISLRDYVIDFERELEPIYGPDTGNVMTERLLASLDRIRRRLGGERHRRLRRQLQQALRDYTQQQQLESLRHVIAILLRDYYDPMYDYQLQTKQQRIVFRGNHTAIRNWLRHYTQCCD